MSSVPESRVTGDTSGGDLRSSLEAPNQWSRVKTLFLEALERPASERSDFVAQACGDDARVREEVDSLLARDEAAANLFEAPAARLLAGEAFSPAEFPPRLSPGTRLGVYEISDFIAAGGMGEVYRARHSILGRQVAIKTIVRQRFPDASARRRLMREAAHASSLKHPHICTVHEVGEADGAPFIVMEYVDGRPLHELIRRSVPAIRDTLDWGIQIAHALAHAHEHGIIHRDLKSSNVVIDVTGAAIVLDFGLARRLPDASGIRSRDASVTGQDPFVGTLSHMAPEVLRGEPADARSDVWALGVLLYELSTGGLPFAGRTPFETSSAIMGERFTPMSARVPLALRLVIERCLIKDPAKRYPRAREVRDALDAITRRRAWPLVGRLLISVRRRTVYAATAAVALSVVIVAGHGVRSRNGTATGHPVSSISVLPVDNATGDPHAAYYANGITDALIAQLGAATAIRVFSPTSAARVAASARTLTGPGPDPAADILLSGRLRQATDQTTLDMELLQPSDGRVLWSESFHGNARDVLALEGDIVRHVAEAARLPMRREARERLGTARAVRPEVYEAYLKGRYEWNKRTQKSLELAVGHFSEAVALDPTYAPAHAALADCFNLLGTVMLGAGGPRQLRPRAVAEAIQTLQIDPYSAEAHAALGYAWHYELRWADAERELRRAIELNPSYSLAHAWYGNLLMSRLRMGEALAQMDTALQLDPFSLIVNTNVAWTLARSRRPDDAIARLEHALTLDSNYVQAHMRLARELSLRGRIAEAFDHGRRVVALTDSSSPAIGLIAEIDARAGRRREARRLLAQLLARSRHEYVPPAVMALVFESLDDQESTLDWLERAFVDKSNAMAYLAGEYPNRPLRRNPRFLRLLSRAGLSGLP
ncbi:MAG: serine/threonine-protein kinase [Gemmatimonadaceae bacterium]